MSTETNELSSPQSSGRRVLLIGAIEGGSFNFATGCIVGFWGLFIQYGCDEYGIPGRGVSMNMYVHAVLLVAETVASFIGASIVERLERRKLFVVAMGLCTHGAWFLFGFVILAVPLTWFLPLAFVLLLWRGFFDGMLISPWYDLAARVVPPRERAAFFSVRLFSSTGMRLLGAAAARLVFGLVTVEWARFAWLFWIGGTAAVMSDVARATYREEATPVRRERREKTFGQDMRDMWGLLWGNRYFVRLCLVGVASMLILHMYEQLVSLFATNLVGLSMKNYASLNVILHASAILSCLCLPLLVKRYGWRSTYAMFLAIMALAIGSNGVVALKLSSLGFSRATYLLAAAFGMIGASRAWMVAEANVLYELVDEDKRPSYIVLLRLVANSVSVVTFLCFGYFSVRERPEAVPYAAMFFGIAGAVAAACLLTLFGIRTREDEAMSRQ